MVWIGTTRPVPTVERPAPSALATDYHYIEDVPADAPIRARFTTPCVSYVGSHEGCGCGYNSSDLEWQGIDSVSDALALLGAMTEDERENFLAEQRSRVRLYDLVCAALGDGPVEVYGVWAGDENTEVECEQAVDPTWLVQSTTPIEEGVRYRVLSDRAAAP